MDAEGDMDGQVLKRRLSRRERRILKDMAKLELEWKVSADGEDLEGFGESASMMRKKAARMNGLRTRVRELLERW